MKTLLITPKDISEVLKRVGIDNMMDRMIAALTLAFQKVGKDGSYLRSRDGYIDQDDSFSCVEWMPHLNKTERSISVKMIAYQPRNIKRFGLPTVIGTTSLYDFNNGHLVTICDAVILTAIRTGAASAIASQILARPDSSIICLVGAGSQAVTQLHALSRIFSIREVLVYDIDPKVAHSFPERTEFLDIPVRVCSLKELEQRSDIVCTATSVKNGADPVISGQYLREHVHINAVGADQPEKTELPLSLLKKSFVCPDFIDQAMTDGECQQLKKEEISPSLFELLEKPQDYYKWREQRTIFDSTGLALEDQVALQIMQELVEEEGLGQHLSLEYFPADPHNPYEFMNISEPQNLVPLSPLYPKKEFVDFSLISRSPTSHS
jgi:ornithine cyclodeaminase/alanine dehydrogenase-like protein (mu-crystallin family)